MSGPHPFTLRQLQYAAAVADLASFTRASERCHVSQPSLSAQVAELEGSLGVRLFERDRRRVVLTPAGAEVVARARQLLVEADELVTAARHTVDPLQGTLRLGVIPTVSPYLLPRASPALRRAFPRLVLRWTEDKTSTLVARLARGELEGCVLALEADLGDVEHEVIARDPFVLATPRGHPLASARTPMPAGTLRGESVLLLDDGHCFRDQALAVCGAARARELEFRATSLTTLAQMVASGMGVTLLPALAVSTEARGARLALRALADPAPHRTVALVWRPRSPLEPSLRRLAGVLRDAYPRAAIPGGRRPPSSRKPVT